MATQAEIKQAQAAYLREWRRKHPEKNKQYVESYWSRRIERMKAEKMQTSQTAGTETNGESR